MVALGLHCSAQGLCCYTQAFSSCSERGLLSSHDAWTSHCGGFSCYRAEAVGHGGISSYGMWAQQLWQMGLVAPLFVGS